MIRTREFDDILFPGGQQWRIWFSSPKLRQRFPGGSRLESTHRSTMLATLSCDMADGGGMSL